MRYSAGTLVFSPTDLVRFLENPFLTWMDRRHLEDRHAVTPDPVPEAQQLVRQTALDRERMVIEGLRRDGHEVVDISDAKGTAAGPDLRHEATLAAMFEGREFIVQAELRGERISGVADFLRRVDVPSRLGGHGYEVWDAKLATRVKPGHLVQLCAYAEILGELQGVWPDEVAVVLGSGEIERFPARDYRFFYAAARDALFRQQAEFDPSEMPEPLASGRNDRWESEAKRWLVSQDHLSLVAGITRTQVKRLEAAGVRTREDLSVCERAHVPRVAPAVLRRLRHQAALQIRSEGLETPVYEVLDPAEWPSDRTSDADPRRGLRLLPPRSPGDVVFDMEGDPFVEGGLEYLFGFVHLDDAGEQTFRDFWAHDRRAERRAFEDVVDWLQARCEAFPDLHIYHYASYEVAAMRRLASAHGTREEVVDGFLRAERFVDLYRVVQQGVRIGVSSYSLKEVEHLYRGTRVGDVSTAVDSVARYEEWLDQRDGEDWQTSGILRGIRDYNRDDCESTWGLLEWLWERQAEAGQTWSPPSSLDGSAGGESSTKKETPNSLLAAALLAELPEDPSEREVDAEGWRIHELIAHLLEFHAREAKPVFWALFERQAMSEDQLYDDLECLAGLQRTAAPMEKDKNSFLFEYAFDPMQDTKLRKYAYFAHDLAIKAEIRDLDLEEGRLRLRIGPKAMATLGSTEPPQRLSLLPDEFVSSASIEAALAEVGEAYASERSLSPALATLLRREAPVLRNHATGSVIVTTGASLVEAAIEAVRRMEETTLCIQGPPGTGKTYTGARIILALLEEGKRVGITANSHKAVVNLMERVIQLGRDVFGSGPVIATKVGGDEDDSVVAHDEVSWCKQVEDAPPGANLFGGTAWAFTRKPARGLFDYLFVDEAGQVSLANIAALSTSTKNLVFLGDQMQLSQPTRARHPGDSGQSCLDYLLKGHPTIPRHLGVFLAESWRMHPALCAFVSDAIYEGRLTARPEAARRDIVPCPGARLLARGAGLSFVPVVHEGNTQGSDEEVEVVVELVEELIRSTFREGEVSRKLDLGDLLVVAPYNLQVHRLRDRLGPRARVGTIDKFQGQEAPVSIVTMCSSSGEASPRGVDFLFDPHRLNVAISRAQCLAIVVGHPGLVRTPCATAAHARKVNLFCRVVEEGQKQGAGFPGSLEGVR